jgi:hypothetical protein
MAMDPNFIGALRGLLAPGMPPVNPTVDQLVAHQTGLPSPAPAPVRPGPRRVMTPNLQRMLTLLGRTMSAPATPPPPPAPEGPPADQGTPPADTAAAADQPIKMADEKYIKFHGTNVRRLAQLLGGGLTPHERLRVNEMSAQKLLRLGREARDDELMDVAEELIAEFNAAADTPAAASGKAS